MSKGPNHNPNPGMNPNVRAAKPSKNRSGLKNTPRQSAPKPSFIDPLEEPVPLKTEITDSIKPGCNIVGHITLDPKQINICADMCSDIADSVRDRLASKVNFPEVKNMTKSVYHIATAAQMYSSLKLLSQNSGQIYKFKSLMHLNLEVPKFMCSMTQNYGHFKAKDGIIQVKHLQTMMIRQVTKALACADIDFNLGLHYEHDHGDSYYADTPDFQDMLNDTCLSIMSKFDLEYQVTIGTDTLRTRLPIFNPEKVDEYQLSVNKMVNDSDVRAKLIIASNSYGKSYSDFSTNVAVANQLLLGLRELPYSLSELNHQIGYYGTVYTQRFLHTLKELFEVSHLAMSETGSPSQVIKAGSTTFQDFKGTETSGTHSYDISDSSAAFGFILMPCLSLDYEPKYHTYCTLTRQEVLNKFAQESFKQ